MSAHHSRVQLERAVLCQFAAPLPTSTMDMIMTTAEGGMVTTASGELASRLRTFRTHGIHRDGGAAGPDDGLGGTSSASWASTTASPIYSMCSWPQPAGAGGRVG